MNIDKSKFGEFIYKLRKEKGMTQKELAEHLHVTKQAISKWECGNSYPDIEMFESLAEALDISIYELFNGEKLSADFIFTQQQIEQTFSQFINSCKNELSYKLSRGELKFQPTAILPQINFVTLYLYLLQRAVYYRTLFSLLFLTFLSQFCIFIP